MIRVVTIKEDGLIYLTKDELEEMLNQAYDDGYKDGKGNLTITTPSTKPYTPYWDTSPYCTSGNPMDKITYTVSKV